DRIVAATAVDHFDVGRDVVLLAGFAVVGNVVQTDVQRGFSGGVIDDVVTAAAVHDIRAGAAVQRIIAAPADQRVVAGVAEQGVISAGADQRVVPGAAVDCGEGTDERDDVVQ